MFIMVNYRSVDLVKDDIALIRTILYTQTPSPNTIIYGLYRKDQLQKGCSEIRHVFS